METDQAEQFYTPPFLMVLCAMSAMSFILSTMYWLWCKGVKGESFTQRLEKTVWQFQLYSALAVISVFMANNVYRSLCTEFSEGITFGPELIVLGGTLTLFAFHCHREGVPILSSILRELKMIVLLVLSCIVAWFVTVVSGWTLGALTYSLFSASSGKAVDFGFLAALLTGLLWILPLYLLYRRLPVKEPKFYDILWPVVFAYLVLLVPLQLQHTVNSAQWQEMKTAKPPLKSAQIWLSDKHAKI